MNFLYLVSGFPAMVAGFPTVMSVSVMVIFPMVVAVDIRIKYKISCDQPVHRFIRAA